VGVVEAIQVSGRTVPGDESVVGFDDNPVARTTRPELTTVRQDSRAKGRAAAELMLVTLDGPAPSSKRARQVNLPTELVVRDSTALAASGRRVGRSARVSTRVR
jgi:LacI family transcriptional regulator